MERQPKARDSMMEGVEEPPPPVFLSAGQVSMADIPLGAGRAHGSVAGQVTECHRVQKPRSDQATHTHLPQPLEGHQVLELRAGCKWGHVATEGLKELTGKPSP